MKEIIQNNYPVAQSFRNAMSVAYASANGKSIHRDNKIAACLLSIDPLGTRSPQERGDTFKSFVTSVALPNQIKELIANGGLQSASSALAEQRETGFLSGTEEFKAATLTGLEQMETAVKNLSNSDLSAIDKEHISTNYRALLDAATHFDCDEWAELLDQAQSVAADFLMDEVVRARVIEFARSPDAMKKLKEGLADDKQAITAQQKLARPHEVSKFTSMLREIANLESFLKHADWPALATAARNDTLSETVKTQLNKLFVSREAIEELHMRGARGDAEQVSGKGSAMLRGVLAYLQLSGLVLRNPQAMQREPVAGYPLWEALAGRPHDQAHADQVCHDFAHATATLEADSIVADTPLDASTTQIATLIETCPSSDSEMHKKAFATSYSSAFNDRMRYYQATSMPPSNEPILITPRKPPPPDRGGMEKTASDMKSRKAEPTDSQQMLEHLPVEPPPSRTSRSFVDSIGDYLRTFDKAFTDLVTIRGIDGAITNRESSASAIDTSVANSAISDSTITPLASEVPLASQSSEPTNDELTQPPGWNADVIVVRSADSLHRKVQTVFKDVRTQAHQYDRAQRILLQALPRSGNMTEADTNAVSRRAQMFIDRTVNTFPDFSENERLSDFMKQRQTQDVATFLNHKYLIFREITKNPGATDTELLSYAQSIIGQPNKNSPLPSATAEPFVEYLERLLSRLEWIDLDLAKKNIATPLQAINALQLFNYGDDGLAAKPDGLALGESLARGATLASQMSAMGPTERARLDAAALLYQLVIQPSFPLKISDGTVAPDTLPLGEQLYRLRRSFLLNLREEWQFSRMFVANENLSNVHINYNALANAQGKTWEDLVNDPSIQKIPGFRTLDPRVQKALVRRKLDRMGESTEYRFGTLQHGLATVLKRSLLMLHRPVPESFGTEAQLVEKFLALAREWDQKPASMLNPRLMLAQYLAHASGEQVTSPSATEEQNLNALEVYLNERWSANYLQLERFDRSAAALSILQNAFGSRATLQDLTVTKFEFSRPFGRDFRRYHEVKAQTVLERFLFLADQPMASDRFVFHGIRFHPRAQLQAAERAYNKMIKENPWVDARAKENLRTSGRELNQQNINAEREVLLGTIRTETETERERAIVLKNLRGTPIIGNIFRFAEGIYLRDWKKAVGAVPVLGNIFEFGAGVVTGDVPRTLGAIPLFGDGVQIEEAARYGDDTDIALAVEGAIFDVGTIAINRASSRARAGDTAHVVMKEAELPTGLSIGMRNAWAMSKGLGVTLERHPELSDTVAEETNPQSAASSQGKPILILGDLYGIQLSDAADDARVGNSRPTPNARQFGTEIDAYQVTGPSSNIAPNAAGIYKEGNNNFIKQAENFYSVRYDQSAGTWRLFDRSNGAKWDIPIRYQDGKWQFNDRIGLRGGIRTNHESATADSVMDKFFNREMKSIDAFRARRMRFIMDNNEAYPKRSFDVEGSPYRWEPEVCPATGKPYFDIRTIGRPDKVMSINGKLTSPKEFAAHITGYVKPGAPITAVRLIASYAGRGGKFSFGQGLADALGVPVLAYTDRINILEPGKANSKAVLFMPRAGRQRTSEARPEGALRAGDAQHGQGAVQEQARLLAPNSGPPQLPSEVSAELQTLRNTLQDEPRLSQYFVKPDEKCWDAARDVKRILHEKGYEDTHFRGLYIWKSPRQTAPANHFLVIASINGREYAVDITAGQFPQFGLYESMIEDEAVWLKRYQQGAADRVIKYKDFSGPAQMQAQFGHYNNVMATDTIAGSTLITRPGWYETAMERAGKRRTQSQPGTRQ